MANPRPLSADTTQLGPWLASCGPTERKPHHVILGVVLCLFGVGLFFGPYLREAATPEDFRGIWWLFTFLGTSCILAGLGILALIFFTPPQEIHLFAGGLVARSGVKEQVVPWSAILELKLYEQRERLMPRTIVVVIKVKGQRNIEFDSTLTGDADRIIQHLADHVPQAVYVTDNRPFG